MNTKVQYVKVQYVLDWNGELRGEFDYFKILKIMILSIDQGRLHGFQFGRMELPYFQNLASTTK